MKENHSTIVLFWRKSSRHVFILLFYEWRSSLLSWFHWYMMMTLCFKDSREEDLWNDTWWSLSCWFSLSLQQYCCWSIHSKFFLTFEAVYHSLFQMFTLSDDKTHIIWSFAINNWILNFISHCHDWFHFQTLKNQFRFECNDNNHLQVL